MTIKNAYRLTFLTGVIVFVIQNIYFGWNETAQSGMERVLDAVSWGLMVYGGFSAWMASVTEEVIKNNDV
jgi:hypothetical protein